MTDQLRPPNRELRQVPPDEDFELPPDVEDPDDRVQEPLEEPYEVPEPPTFTPSPVETPSSKPQPRPTGLPSDAPGG